MGECIRGVVKDGGICKDDVERVLQKNFESQTIVLGLDEKGGFVFTNKSKKPLGEAQKKVAEVFEDSFGDKVILTNTNQAAEAA